MSRWVMKSDVLDSSETGGPAPSFLGVVFFIPPKSRCGRDR